MNLEVSHLLHLLTVVGIIPPLCHWNLKSGARRLHALHIQHSFPEFSLLELTTPFTQHRT
jgi:hypothetical protein